jgi:hypothetical protein
MAVLKLRRLKMTASIDVIMLLPTPPLPLTTPMTFLTLLRGLGFARRSSLEGFLDAQLLLHVEQSCVQVTSSFSKRITSFNRITKRYYTTAKRKSQSYRAFFYKKLSFFAQTDTFQKQTETTDFLKKRLICLKKAEFCKKSKNFFQKPLPFLKKMMYNMGWSREGNASRGRFPMFI